MNKRLAMLEQMAASGQADSFALYALGMEYRKEGRREDALATFAKLRDKDAAYLPVYLMAGQCAVETENAELARTWLEQGVLLAQQKGDTKTLGELQSALAEIAE